MAGRILFDAILRYRRLGDSTERIVELTRARAESLDRLAVLDAGAGEQPPSRTEEERRGNIEP